MPNGEKYTDTEKISEVAVTLAFEKMDLDNNDIQLLQAIKNGKLTTEEARVQILSEV